jgi:hypothetical protein
MIMLLDLCANSITDILRSGSGVSFVSTSFLSI